MPKLLHAACSPLVVKNSLRIAAVVGTVLNIVNQGQAFLSLGEISVWHLLLNYMIPYSVASYSAAKNELGREL